MYHGCQLLCLPFSTLNGGSWLRKATFRAFRTHFEPGNSHFTMVLRKRKAGGGDAPRKKGASWSSAESSVSDNVEFVRDSDSDVDFTLDIASDDDDDGDA